jgi:hypothetical protein
MFNFHFKINLNLDIEHCPFIIIFCPTLVGQKILHQLLTGKFQTNLSEQKSVEFTTLIYARNDNKSKQPTLS